jgi:hypothetical protein
MRIEPPNEMLTARAEKVSSGVGLLFVCGSSSVCSVRLSTRSSQILRRLAIPSGSGRVGPRCTGKVVSCCAPSESSRWAAISSWTVRMKAMQHDSWRWTWAPYRWCRPKALACSPGNSRSAVPQRNEIERLFRRLKGFHRIFSASTSWTCYSPPSSTSTSPSSSRRLKSVNRP